MGRAFTQAEIYNYLCDNPYDINVHIGDLEDMQGNDYVFFDYLTENIIGADNKSVAYRVNVQFTIAVKDFTKIKPMVDYIKDMFVVTVNYEKSEEHEYYLARCETWVFIYG